MIVSTFRELVDDLGEQGGKRPVEDDHLVLGVIGDVGELLGEQPDVERVEHGAHARHRQVRLHMALVVPHEGADPVPGSNAEFGEGGGELIGPVGDLGERRLRDVVGAVAGQDLGVGRRPDARAASAP